MSELDVVVDSDKLTAALAVRLAAIVPDGFEVRASDGMLWYTCAPGRFPGQLNNYRGDSSGTHVRNNFEACQESSSDADSAAWMARWALDELQDFVDEATHDPWPGTSRPPKPHGQVRGEMLHFWYGGEDVSDEPVLVCEPIPLVSLQP
jgi:hypothetical protein